MGCFGGGGGSGEASLNFQREQVEKQHEYDKKQYSFQWDESKDKAGNKKGTMWQNYDYQKDSIKIAQDNDLAAKKYKEETANQQWNYQNEVKTFQEELQTRLYNKNQVQVAEQFTMNEAAASHAVKEVDRASEEAFIDAAFQNQQLVDDLWHSTGSLGLEKAKTTLGLAGKESELEYQQDKTIVEYGQEVSKTKYDTAGAQLNLADATTKAGFQKAGTTQNLLTTQAKNAYDKQSLMTDLASNMNKSKYEMSVLRRDVNQMQAKSAFADQENTIKHLQSVGQATASGQAGRSQGKAIQAFAAALGRQGIANAQEMIYGKNKAEATARLLQETNLYDTQKAAQASQQIDLKSLDAIQKAGLALEGAEHDLKMAGKKTDLNISQLNDSLLGVTELTNLSTKQIDNQMKNAQNQAGIDFSKFDLESMKGQKDFELNKNIMQASLDSALAQSGLDLEQIGLKKAQADLQTQAMSQLKPEAGPAIPQPLPLPTTVYQDPQKPTKPPEPIKGAMPTYAGPGAGQKVLSGAVAGLGTAAMMGAFKAGGAGGWSAAGGWAGPLGLAVGIGTMLFG
jgi:hypothetical protein